MPLFISTQTQLTVWQFDSIKLLREKKSKKNTLKYFFHEAWSLSVAAMPGLMLKGHLWLYVYSCG